MADSGLESESCRAAPQPADTVQAATQNFKLTQGDRRDLLELNQEYCKTLDTADGHLKIITH